MPQDRRAEQICKYSFNNENLQIGWKWNVLVREICLLGI